MSIIQLNSEKVIGGDLQTDASDSAYDFVNYFKTPIEIYPQDSIELVSVSINQPASITINLENNRFCYTICNATENHFEVKNIVIPTGTYTLNELASVVEEQLKNSMAIDSINLTCTIDKSNLIKITWEQVLPPDSCCDGELRVNKNATAAYNVNLSLSKESTTKDMITTITSNGTSNNDVSDNIRTIVNSEFPISTLGGETTIELMREMYLDGIDVESLVQQYTLKSGTIKITLNDNSSLDYIVSKYDGTNTYDIKLVNGTSTFYAKFIEINELDSHDRESAGELLFLSNTDIAIPDNLPIVPSTAQIVSMVQADLAHIIMDLSSTISNNTTTN